MDDKPVIAAPKLEFPEQLFEAYANNVLYESSVWDLKFVFGQLDQSAGTAPAKVTAHSAITVPWAQAKLIAYWLRVQIEVQEMTIGKIKIPAAVIPPPPPPLTDELKRSDPNAEKVYALIGKLRDEFVASLEK
jgi:hypothetical protein